MMHRRPELDTKNPPGQIVNPIPQTLNEFIREELAKDPDVLDPPKPESVEDAYLRGYSDGIKEGFQRGIKWMRGN